MYKYLTLIALCLLLRHHVFAQNVIDSSQYNPNLIRSLGFAFSGLKYPFLSPLYYSGYSFTAHSNRFRNHPKYLSQLQLHLEIGWLTNQSSESHIAPLSGQVEWSMHWYATNQKNKFRLLLGASADAGIYVFSKEDNVNNPFAYFFNLSLSPNIMAKYRFDIKNTHIELGQQLDVAALSLTSISGYSSSIPYAMIEEKTNFWEALNVVSFGKFLSYKGITSIDIIPNKAKCPSFRISYIFSSMDYDKNSESMQYANQTFLFGVIFKLSKYQY